MAQAVDRVVGANTSRSDEPNTMALSVSATSQGSVFRVVRRPLATVVAMTCLAGTGSVEGEESPAKHVEL